jgi:hypothetical protein
MSTEENLNEGLMESEQIDIKESLSVEIEAAPDMLDENYRSVAQTYIPEEAKKLYKEKGWELLWVRVYKPHSDELDSKHIQKNENDMITFVPRGEVPGLSDAMSKHFGEQLSDSSHGLYIVGDVALAKWPIARKKQREEFVNNRTRSRSQAVINDLRKNSVMPDSSREEGWSTVREQPKARTDVDVEFGSTT